MTDGTMRLAGWLIGVSLVMLSLVVVYLLTARAAEPLPAHLCKEGYEEAFKKGNILPCDGILVQPETLRAYHDAIDAKPALVEKVRLLEDQVVNLRGQVVEVRTSGEGQLKVCENFRAQCEAAKTPPKCLPPPWGERPGFTWPVGLGIGFFGGFAFDHWGVGCK